MMAVALLAYQITIAKAQYELRAERLRDCADRLQQLERELAARAGYHSGNLPLNELLAVQSRYSEILADSETHTANDYRIAMLGMRGDYTVTGLIRAAFYLKYQINQLADLAPHLLLLSIELIFILDILGKTVFVPWLLSSLSGSP